MTDLSEASLEDAIIRITLGDAEAALLTKPTKIIVQPCMRQLALHVLFYKPPIRRASGARKRKLALYWR